MSEVTKASKRHCWSTRSPADAYEAGFESGAAFAFHRAQEYLNAKSLFLAIGHGDQKHQDWLKTELDRWFQVKFHLCVEGALVQTHEDNGADK